MISGDVVIMTRAELKEHENTWFQKGVVRGRFEERMDAEEQRKRIREEYQESGLVRLARPPAPDGDGTTVGPQAAAQPITGAKED